MEGDRQRDNGRQTEKEGDRQRLRETETTQVWRGSRRDEGDRAEERSDARKRKESGNSMAG